MTEWTPNLNTKTAVEGFLDTLIRTLPDLIGIDEIISGCRVINVDPYGVGVNTVPRYMRIALRDEYHNDVWYRGNITLAVDDFCTVIHIKDGDRYEIGWAGGSTGSDSVLHNLLSLNHPDTNVAAVAQGDVIVGDGTPEWSRLAVGAANEVLTNDATDVFWSAGAIDLTAGHTLTVDEAKSLSDYFLADGSRTLTGDLDLGAGVDIIPTNNGQNLGDVTHRLDLFTDEVIFCGPDNENVIWLTDNYADALHIRDVGNVNEYLTFVTTNAQREVVFNEQGADIDVRVESATKSHAFFVDASTNMVGIGAIPGAHLDVYDAALDTTVPYMGFRSHHVKTAGASGEEDDLYGIYAHIEMDHNAAVIGHVVAVQGVAKLTDGTIGDGQEDLRGGSFEAQMAGGTVADDVMAFYARANLDAGTVSDDVYGCYIRLDIEAAMTGIGGDVYGVYVYATVDKDPTGSAYLFYLAGSTNIDYALYVASSAPSLFSGNLILDDNAGNSPLFRLVGGSNDDTITIYLVDDAVAGDSDLYLQLAAADSGSKFSVRASTGAERAYFDAAGNSYLYGNAGFGIAPNAAIGLFCIESTTLLAGDFYGLAFRARAYSLVGNFTTSLRGFSGGAEIMSAVAGATRTGGIGVRGGEAYASVVNGVDVRDLYMSGAYFYTDVEDAGVGGGVGAIEAAAFIAETPRVDTGNCTDGYGVKVNQGMVGAGTLVNLFGVYVAAMTAGGTTNYSIYTNAGLVRFGDDVGIGMIPTHRLDVLDDRVAYIAWFFNDGNNDNRQGIGIQCCADANPAGRFLLMLNGFGAAVGQIIGDGAGGVTYVSISDERKKNVLGPVSQDLAMRALIEIDPIRYVGKGLTTETGQSNVGFSAQDVYRYFPEVAIHDEKEDLYSIAYERLTPVLWAQNQALLARIEILEATCKSHN